VAVHAAPASTLEVIPDQFFLRFPDRDIGVPGIGVTIGRKKRIEELFA